MADKLTQQIIDALTRGAAEPGGLPLYASKADAGLFPNSAGAKAAAQKCLADQLVVPVATDPKGKAPRERYALTEKGWEFLLAAVNPKQVLEDFVRVLEARQGEVGELLDTARHMAASLQGLRDAVARVLPGVTAGKIQKPAPREDVIAPRLAVFSPFSVAPVVAEVSAAGSSFSGAPRGAERTGPTSAPRGAEEQTSPSNPPKEAEEKSNPPDLAPAIRAHLADRAGPTDCPLPELFRALTLTVADAPTIGQFHDCLRRLHADGTVSVTAWAGPLYALPEPQYALLIGHGIAYYAALK